MLVAAFLTDSKENLTPVEIIFSFIEFHNLGADADGEKINYSSRAIQPDCIRCRSVKTYGSK